MRTLTPLQFKHNGIRCCFGRCRSLATHEAGWEIHTTARYDNECRERVITVHKFVCRFHARQYKRKWKL